VRGPDARLSVYIPARVTRLDRLPTRSPKLVLAWGACLCLHAANKFGHDARSAFSSDLGPPKPFEV